MGDDVRFSSAAIVQISQDDEGEYTVTQVDGQDRIPKAPESSDIIIPFSFSEGPVTISGQIDTSTLSIQVELKVLGFKIGSFSGSLKKGVTVKINLGVAKGQVTLFLKNGNELWIKVDLTVVFGHNVHFEKKILTLPI